MFYDNQFHAETTRHRLNWNQAINSILWKIKIIFFYLINWTVNGIYLFQESKLYKLQLQHYALCIWNCVTIYFVYKCELSVFDTHTHTHITRPVISNIILSKQTTALNISSLYLWRWPNHIYTWYCTYICDGQIKFIALIAINHI